MDVSIIIVNWNTRDYLQRCLNSILQYTEGIDFEVIAVDNASSDSSARMVEEKFPLIKLIKNKENVGFAKATNQAIRESSGRYILLLNPDTEVLESPFRVMIEFMDKNPEVGICGSRILNPDGTPQSSCARFPSVFTAFIHMTKLNNLYPDNRITRRFRMIDIDSNCVSEVDSISGVCLMASRKMMEEVGFLDESFFMYCEDLDWCYRARKKEWKIYYLPKGKIVHYRSKSNIEGSKKIFIEGYRSWFIYLRKNVSKAKIWLLKAGVIIIECVKSIVQYWKFQRFLFLLREIKSF